MNKLLIADHLSCFFGQISFPGWLVHAETKKTIERLLLAHINRPNFSSTDIFLPLWTFARPEQLRWRFARPKFCHRDICLAQKSQLD